MTEGKGDWKWKQKGKTHILTSPGFEGVPEGEQQRDFADVTR